MAKKPYSENEKNVRSVRLDAIRDLISKEKISSQQDLLKRLREQGFDVTQGTVSRDVRDLGLFKSSAPEGGYRLTLPVVPETSTVPVQFLSLFKSAVLHVDQALNQVVIRCGAGMASAVCAAMDAKEWDGLLGTIAGDDTILVILKSEEQAASFAETLKNL